MSIRSTIVFLWFLAVICLSLVLPPAGWQGADALAFTVSLAALTAVAYGLLLLSAALGWLQRLFEGPSTA